MDSRSDVEECDDGLGKRGQRTAEDGDDSSELDEQACSVSAGASSKTWAILAGIFILIAVAILYVYQTGDSKTVLGNQPIPAQPVVGYGQPVALHVPNGGHVHNARAEGGVRPSQPSVSRSAGEPSQSSVQCPKCGSKGVPLCSSCGTVMNPLGNDPSSGLFSCPSCGVVGVMICPRCGSSMESRRRFDRQQKSSTWIKAARSVGGQFQCPACGATGLPNWSANGAAKCPNCGAQMNTRGVTSPHLAAAP